MIYCPDVIKAALAKKAAVAVGVSGGKDSCAVAIAVAEFLSDYGGPKLLIHSDLGGVEWKDSAATCLRLAQRLGWELVVVRRKAGGMMERWEQRWHNNVVRYINLECVKLILPWSTPSMRFCTSELKSAVIASELKKRFSGPIISVTGIRAAESPSRAKQPVMKVNKLLERKSDNTQGWDWNAIHDWSTERVYSYLEEKQFELHEAYRVYGSTRVSCAFCIMSSENDKQAAARCLDNAPTYVRMVRLELASGFSFQSGKWLADVSPALLPDDLRQQVEPAKKMAAARAAIEARIPKELEFEKSCPKFVPDLDQCELIAGVRREVGVLQGLKVRYTTAAQVQARYRELMDDALDKHEND